MAEHFVCVNFFGAMFRSKGTLIARKECVITCSETPYMWLGSV